MNHTMKLCELRPGQDAVISEVMTRGSMKRRFTDIGMIPGTHVRCVFRSPGKDMKAYWIRGAVIAIRNEDCREITVFENGGTAQWD